MSGVQDNELRRLVSRVSRAIDRELRRAGDRFGLTADHALALAELGTPCTVGELAVRMGRTSPEATFAVSRLADLRLVDRHRQITLTAHGLTVHTQLTIELRARSPLRGLAEPDRTLLRDLLAKAATS